MHSLQLVVLLGLAAIVFGAPLPNQITNLPGLNFPINYTMYSGYITVNQTEGRNLFYWFVTSQNNPSTDPLIAWFNGGPGCSSLLGLFTENGPFSVNDDGATLSPNPYSWNRIANVLYTESPAGVGFSYTQQKPNRNGDNITMAEAYYFLQQFFKLYPQFSTNPFYIAGESYGGHYVPQLAWTVLNGNEAGTSKIPLKGILVGNPWTDDKIDSISVPEFIYSHAMASVSDWEAVSQACFVNGSVHSREWAVPFKRFFHENVPFLKSIEIGAEGCNKAINQLVNQVGDLINQYDIYVPCVEHGESALGCVNNSALLTYLNSIAVKTAIHAKTDLPRWTECTNVNYVESWPSVLPIYPQLMKSINVTIYTGDVTFNVPFLGTGIWTNLLGAPTGVLHDWEAWTVPNPLGPQVGGYVKRFNGITYVTVRNAGHMVPQYQPYPAFVMFSNYLAGTL